MNDIELVIKISEEDYKGICHLKNEQLRMLPEEVAETLMRIANGTPLPKGHGVLKDVEKIYADMEEKVKLARQRVYDTPTNSPCYMRYVAHLNERTAFQEMLCDAPAIIEADKEYDVEIITRGNCMMCGKELGEGLFFCKECEQKQKARIRNEIT